MVARLLLKCDIVCQIVRFIYPPICNGIISSESIPLMSSCNNLMTIDPPSGPPLALAKAQSNDISMDWDFLLTFPPEIVTDL
mmetsp:Transcript_33420/g.44596  ORF Transcript_33420/g.44596 Transcript_33420/m.44596 type:complete len:82 (+) Transcript_33420:69-314(+)